MVKYCIDKYPMGSFKKQKSPGKCMDGWLHKALDLYSRKIVDDMTFLGIIFSSTLEVGTGKSVLATQIGEAWTELVNKNHGLNIPFTINNIVWKPKDLIERAFNIPKYSCIILDEWEDASYWSELGMTLRQFFRKCRQLNLFMICIIPNWFQLPLPYAVSRSAFAIDVKFNNQLDRGFFDFYNFPAKKNLYILGKRTHNYGAWKRTFPGNFVDGYGVDEAEYRKKKYDDMVEYDKENPVKLTKSQIEGRMGIKYLQSYLKKYPKATLKECAEVFGVSTSTIVLWKRGAVEEDSHLSLNYTIEPVIKKEVVMDEEAMEQIEREKGIYNEEEMAKVKEPEPIEPYYNSTINDQDEETQPVVDG